MGYFFTLLFIATAYITPTVLFGPLGEYHLVVIIAVLAFLCSIPNFGKSGIARLPQLWAVLGLCFMVALSVAIKVYIRGLLDLAYDFLPTLFAFILVAVNVRRKWQLRLLVLAIFLGSVYFIVRGLIDLSNNHLTSAFLYTQEAVPRIEGLGIVHDPNDFAQVLVSLIPLTFLWRTRSRFLNFLILTPAIAILITGMYFTHSRGSAIALMAVVAVAFRRKIGTVPAVIIAGLLFAGVLAAGWGAGRDVSMEAGADRLDAWATGIDFIKHNPVLGIGYRQFAERNNITAHNSIVVCAAEIGIPGFLLWVLFVFSSFRDSLKIAKAAEPATAAAPDDTAAGHSPPQPTTPLRAPTNPAEFWAAQRRQAQSAPPAAVSEPSPAVPAPAVALPGAVSPADLRSMALVMTVALTGFLTAGWFLSRALSTWLFMYCGMVCALLRMSRDSGLTVPPDRLPWLLRWTAIVGFSLILLVYLILRIRNLVPH